VAAVEGAGAVGVGVALAATGMLDGGVVPLVEARSDEV
jgi:hypothetical protein